MQYSQEYDERMPAVKFNNVSQSVSPYAKPFGWADALQLYMKSTYILQCLSEPQTDNGTDATQNGFTDYWYNTNLAKVKLEKIDSPAQTLMAGDGNDGTDATNARYTLNALPQSWRDTEKSPARRHLDTANYLFADGHVKSIKPKDIDNLPVAKSKSTFSVR